MTTQTNSAIELALFDLDGTLLDSGDDIAAAANRLRVAQDLPSVTTAQVLEWVGDGAGALVERAIGLPAGATSASADAAAHLDAFREDYGANLQVMTKPYPGIERILKRFAKDGIRMAVVSNKPVGMVESLLTGTNLADYFFEALGGDSLVTRKPAPEPIMNIVMRACVRREATVMIGDGPQDILAGQAAGVKTIAVTWGFTSRERLEETMPDEMAEKPGELVKLIELL